MRSAKRSFRISLLVGLITAFGLPLRAQLVNDGFNPSVLGEVRCTTTLPAGHLWIGGSFLRVGATAVSNLARLRWDGSVDMTPTRPNPNGVVRCLMSFPDGTLLVGGDFTEVGGEARFRLARLLADGRNDPAFIAEFDGEVRCLLDDGGTTGDGGVLVGGVFSRVNGQPRAGLVRLLADGSLDADFNPGLADVEIAAVNALIRQPDGKVLLGGNFDNVGGRAAANLARLHPGGRLDAGFGGSTDGEVHAIGVQADVKIVIGGDFSQVSGVAAEKIARLNRDGSFQKTYAGFKDRINAITVQTDGKILAGGRFPAVGRLRYGKLARLLPDMTFDNAYEPFADGEVFACTEQSDGHLLVGGSFTRVDLTTRNGLARLDRSGRTETTIISSAETNGPISTIVQQPDEKLLVAGAFTYYNGTTRGGLARTNSNGLLDSSFANARPGPGVVGLQVRRDQKVLVFGTMTSVADVPRPGIARLTSAGQLDSNFNAGVGGTSPVSVNAVVDLPDGRLLLGGSFSQLGQNSRNLLGRVGETGQSDFSALPAVSGPPNDLISLGGGSVMISGNVRSVDQGGTAILNQPYLKSFESSGFLTNTAEFSTSGKVNGVCRLPDGKFLVWGANLTPGRHILRRLVSGKPDDAFNLTTDGEVRSVNLQADGSMLVVGSFTEVNGASTGTKGLRGVARVLADGKPVTGYRPLANEAGEVRSAMIQQDGKPVLWGSFTAINGSGRPGLARLSATGPAVQELGVVDGGFNLAWQRSGSAPEIERVWFSISNNGTTFGPPQEGRWVHGRWESGSIKLPARSPLWIRAEGRLPSSQGGDAGGLVESVRQVFLDGEVDVAAEGLPRISGEGPPVDFGKTVQGAAPAIRTFTVTNRGTVLLFLNQATVTPGFTLIGPVRAVELEPGGSTTVDVAVDLSSAGARPGLLSIPSNDIDEPVFTVPLQAEVVNPVQARVLKIRTIKNRKTGLREQTIRVTNSDATVTVSGSRVLLAGLPPGVVVRNASGILEDGRYYIDVLQPLGPLGSVDVVVEYFFPLRRPAKVTPVLSTEVISVPTAPGAASALATGTEVPFAIDRFERVSDGSFLLEFRAVPGRRYQVETSTDNRVWKAAEEIRAIGGRVQWVDRTAAGSDKGFYRVRELED